MGGDVWYTPRFPTGAAFQFSMPLSRIISDAPESVPSPRESESHLGTEGESVVKDLEKPSPSS